MVFGIQARLDFGVQAHSPSLSIVIEIVRVIVVAAGLLDRCEDGGALLVALIDEVAGRLGVHQKRQFFVTPNAAWMVARLERSISPSPLRVHCLPGDDEAADGGVFGVGAVARELVAGVGLLRERPRGDAAESARTSPGFRRRRLPSRSKCRG
jgi:hypothetical protein